MARRTPVTHYVGKSLLKDSTFPPESGIPSSARYEGMIIFGKSLFFLPDK